MAPSKLVKGAEPFVCGGSAATFASCVIHPMDLAKVCTKNIAYKKNLLDLLSLHDDVLPFLFGFCHKRYGCNSMDN